MGLAPAVGRVEPKNRRDLATRAGQPPAHVGEQVLEAPGGIGVGKETCRIEIFGVALAEDHLCQIRRKVGLGHRSRENVCAWPAGVEDRGDGHAVFSTRVPGSSGSSSASVHESPGVSNREAQDRSRRAWSVRARLGGTLKL